MVMVCAAAYRGRVRQGRAGVVAGRAVWRGRGGRGVPHASMTCTVA
ncbi:hypothetical protein E2C01_085477 [Portunus trituberculatus]|uniref:Uncharacterized protein n=1 Tax=Portunus trituberculatus TaxID=210409 RepID=A0A5B7JC14_PORTR|nr:hypothetical protein [Portunus trituberculatus]